MSEANQNESMVMRPGYGWKHVSGPVFDHENGMRLHLLGTLRMPDGSFRSAGLDALKMIRINGGNRRRGLMAWAKGQGA